MEGSAPAVRKDASSKVPNTLFSKKRLKEVDLLLSKIFGLTF